MRTIPDVIADLGGRLRGAAGFLTRLPVPAPAAPAAGFLVRAAPSFPIVGAGIGVTGGLIYAVVAAFSLPPLACALAALAAIVTLTGALHEDGLADVCDGIGGGRDRHDRLRIMRDSHNGTFGTLALVLGVGMRASLIAAVAAPGDVIAAMIAAGAISRAALPPVMGLLAPARVSGLAAAAGRPDQAAIIVALGLAALIAWPCLGFGGTLLALAAAGAATAATALLAQRMLGGTTGDVLGACQQAAEIAVLAVAAALAAA
ncbi:MAG: adenosylcobinamide-GDP ribazoletransferase [Rhodospirillales bacterium]